MTAPETILCINAGSSSLKCTLYRWDTSDDLSALATARVEGVGRDVGRMTVGGSDNTTLRVEEDVIADHADALSLSLAGLEATGHPPPAAVGHRVVHGGRKLRDHTIIDDHVLAALRTAVPFAPLHLPAELAAIDAMAVRLPGVPQVVCLDTAFHRNLPPVAKRLPLPRWVHDEGVTRYGFHGLSYEYLVDEIGSDTLGRAVLAHLGSGASLSAVIDGRSIDTTMGFTPTGGVIMATRTGDLDPGTLVYLAREHGLDAAALDRLINQESGLLGISGSSADMHELLTRAHDDGEAALAVDMFCDHARKAVGALATMLGGIDTLVFTAGIGENEPAVRARICQPLAYMGIALDTKKNDAGASIISPSTSPVEVRVEPTDENHMIARHVARLVA